MIIDLDRLTELRDPRLGADVCIVGAGAVGLPLAVALAERGASVLVLEGGGAHIDAASQDLHRGESVGHPLTYMETGRYRVLGGTTTYWGGQVYPFDPLILDGRPWLGQSPWPVPAAEMSAWYGRAYQMLGLDRSILHDAGVWRAVGQPPPDFGPDLQMVTTRWVRQRNFARLFKGALRQRGGPHVLTRANVTALSLDPARRRVERLRARSLAGRELEISADRFVLANGTLEIARLLLHPLADGSVAPWADNPWLGAPLMDHLDCVAGEVEILDYERFHDLFDNVFHGGFKYFPKLRLAPDTQRREGLIDIAAQFQYHTRLSAHVEHLKMFLRSLGASSANLRLGELWPHLRGIAATAAPLALRYLRDNRSFKPRDSAVSLLLYTEQLPAASSRVMLGEERDATGLRRLRVDWRIDGRELASMRRFAELVGTELERRGLARLRLDPELESGSPAFWAKVHDAVHQMGTARMAGDRGQGVVDADLKVFDVGNLYIAGAATFPGAGFANPTFTAIALALRLAAHLAGGRNA